MKYKGIILINDIQCRFSFENYVLTITPDNTKFIGWKEVKSIVNNGWIHITDTECNDIYIKTDGVDYLGRNEYCYYAMGYLVSFGVWDKEKKKNISPQFVFNNILIRNDVIDYLFRNDKEYISRAIYLLRYFNGEGDSNKPTDREKYDICIANKKYQMEFVVMVQGNNEPFPYDINNAIRIKGEESKDVEDVWNIVKIMSLFLKFISQSSNLNFDKEIVVYCGNEINESRTSLYMRPNKETKIIREKVLEYDDIKEGLSGLITAIDTNKICFRSLFPVDDSKITYADIMNVCAAFESQYASLHGDFKDKKKSKVKKKMVEIIESEKKQFADDEQVYFDDILNGFRIYKDSLQTRIENAFNEFREIYGEDEIQYDFEQDFLNMPKRIKDTRNALDHGNRDYTFNTNMYWDSELLRAVTYMLILKESGIDNANIKKSLKKLSRHPI